MKKLALIFFFKNEIINLKKKNEVKREINDLKNALNSQSNLLLEKNSEIETMKRKLQINQVFFSYF